MQHTREPNKLRTLATDQRATDPLNALVRDLRPTMKRVNKEKREQKQH